MQDNMAGGGGGGVFIRGGDIAEATLVPMGDATVELSMWVQDATAAVNPVPWLEDNEKEAVAALQPGAWGHEARYGSLFASEPRRLVFWGADATGKNPGGAVRGLPFAALDKPLAFALVDAFGDVVRTSEGLTVKLVSKDVKCSPLVQAGHCKAALAGSTLQGVSSGIVVFNGHVDEPSTEDLATAVRVHAPPLSQVHAVAFVDTGKGLGADIGMEVDIALEVDTCPFGTVYVDQQGCLPCPDGEYASLPEDIVTGEELLYGACRLCDPGSWSTRGNATCTWCAPGYSTAQSGSRECLLCSEGKYSGLGWSVCGICPAGMQCRNGRAFLQPGYWADPTGLHHGPVMDGGIEIQREAATAVQWLRSFREATIADLPCLPQPLGKLLNPPFTVLLQHPPSCEQLTPDVSPGRMSSAEYCHIAGDYFLNANSTLVTSFYSTAAAQGACPPSRLGNLRRSLSNSTATDVNYLLRTPLASTGLGRSWQALAWWANVTQAQQSWHLRGEIPASLPLPAQLMLRSWDYSAINVSAVDVMGIPPTARLLRCLAPGSCQVTSDQLNLKCSPGHGGPLCAVCNDGWVSGRPEEQCIPCAAERDLHVAATVLMAMGMVAFMAVYVVLKVNSSGATKREEDTTRHYGRLARYFTALSQSRDGLLRNLLNFMQTLKILRGLQPTAEAAVHAEAAAAAAASSSANTLTLLNVELPSLDSISIRCITDWSFFYRFYGYLALPPVALLLLLMGVLCWRTVIRSMASLASWCKGGNSAVSTAQQNSTGSAAGNAPDDDETPFLKRVVSRSCRHYIVTGAHQYLKTGSVILLFFFYTSVVSSVLEVFHLYPQPIEGTNRLYADVSVPTTSVQYNTAFWCGIAGVFLYVIGIPGMTALLLWQRRRRLWSPDVMRTFGFLYLGFRPSSYYWEMIIVLRKALLNVASVVFLSKFSGLLVALLVLLLGLVLQLSVRPYDTRLLNITEIVIVTVLMMNACVGLTRLYAIEPSGASLLGVVDSMAVLIQVLNVLLLVVLASLLLLVFGNAMLQHVMRLGASRSRRVTRRVLLGKRPLMGYWLSVEGYSEEDLEDAEIWEVGRRKSVAKLNRKSISLRRRSTKSGWAGRGSVSDLSPSPKHRASIAASNVDQALAHVSANPLAFSHRNSMHVADSVSEPRRKSSRHRSFLLNRTSLADSVDSAGATKETLLSSKPLVSAAPLKRPIGSSMATISSILHRLVRSSSRPPAAGGPSAPTPQHPMATPSEAPSEKH